MPYVPCPINGSASYEHSWPHSRVRRWDARNQTETVAQSGLGSWKHDRKGTRTGDSGPYVTRKGKRWAPVRPYTRTAWQIVYQPGVTKLRSNDNRYTETWEGYPAPEGIWDPPDVLPDYSSMADWSGCPLSSEFLPSIPANTLARLKTELLVKAGRRQVNYGESIAEGKSTLKMLAQSASTLARAVLAARKGNFAKVAKVLKHPRLRLPSSMSLSKKWLAYQYGWMPLMSDIYDSRELFLKGLDLRENILSVSRRIRAGKSGSGWSKGRFKNGYVRVDSTYSGKMFYRIADNFASGLHQLGMINPLEVAWAVVPFSFVVDWFIPVGSFLEAASASVGVDFVDGFFGAKTETVSIISKCEKTTTRCPILVSSNCEVSRYTSGYRRTKMTSVPWPSLYMKNPFSTTHVTSALALLRQLWRR